MTRETFNMKDLANSVAEKFNLSRASSATMTRFIFDTIKNELASGKQVRLHKFGTLEARMRAPGVARNPVNGLRVEVPARKCVKLTVSPALKRRVAN